MIKLIASHRGRDQFGKGSFGASRKGGRTHNGIDYAAAAGNGLRSPVAGRVSKHGVVYDYTTEFVYIEITDKDKLRHRFFYVQPLVPVGEQVEVGDPIGRIQNISRFHEDRAWDGRRMNNHFHYEIKDGGKYLDPEDFV